MYGRLRELWQESDFARENLSFRESVGLLLEKYGYDRDALIMGKAVDCPDLISDFQRAVKGEPLGYILGKAHFYKEEYFVKEGVLIPRCDSEIIVEKAIELIPEGARFADVCTGSGCLGISVLRSRPDLRATLLDISPVSREVALRNIEAQGVSDRCEFQTFDVFSHSLPPCDAVIMNPPYITKEEMKTLPVNVLQEPYIALEGGEDGLDFYRFAANSSDYQDKLLIFEIGCHQGKDLLAMFGKGEVIKDLSGNDRCFVVR